MISAFASSAVVSSSVETLVNISTIEARAFMSSSSVETLATTEVAGYSFETIKQFKFDDGSVLRIYRPTLEDLVEFDLPKCWAKWARNEDAFSKGRGIRSAVDGMPLFGVSIEGLAMMEEAA